MGDETPTEYGIDFSTGQLTGVKVTGVEALKVWAWNALKTARYRFETNDWVYGSELDTLIGQSNSVDYVASEAERMVEECLTTHPMITGISNFDFVSDGEKLTISFRILTDYGDDEMEVGI